MKLASKIFLGSALVMVVLVGVGILSLRAVGHLAAVNRDITMRALPTLGRAGAAHDAVLALVRLETRFLVLGDARYAALWDERAARVREDLAALRRLVRTAREQAVLDVAAGSFARYEAAVEEERRLLKRRQRAEAIRLGETEARSRADQAGQSLEDLVAATHRGAEEARAEAALLEQRTWTGVLVALGCALGLGLGATAVLANRLTRRLRVLSEATAAVAAGSFREPIPERGADEIAALAHSFNAIDAARRHHRRQHRAPAAPRQSDPRSLPPAGGTAAAGPPHARPHPGRRARRERAPAPGGRGPRVRLGRARRSEFRGGGGRG
ncbi:MAG: hypothetical protein AUG80_12510 [Candidatus Rokubacteria bacterium 13_1_20CM_4_68_9]|nr:MAG: hypothetical protein AUG80_12510 [Candidatus Rokubacteria bacterium 13_1_20CM_4_68_9]